MSYLGLIRGRQTVVPLTNKSGVTRSEGEVVVVDITTDDAFTTTTNEGSCGVVGVVLETTAADALGRILLVGYCATLEVGAATSRGDFLKTSATAGKATPTDTFEAGVFAVALSAVGGVGQVSAVLFGPSSGRKGIIGSIVVDVWKDTYANYPPTVADTIAGTEKPTLAAAIKNRDLDLTTWTTACAEGDWIAFNVDSAATVTWVCVVLHVVYGS